ncbi:MAG: PAS domain S-box protein, partial [Chloroflexota bacterium]|nr:PAS domain S-box protein [Chloroflexota bacterium]
MRRVSSQADPPEHEEERSQYAVLEASPNPIVAVDQSAHITYANPQVETAFGFSRAELIGEPVELLIPDRVKERHVGHRNGFLAHTAARPMGIGLDLAARRKDGTEFPVEISLAPVDTTDGLRVFATVVDITARKAAESHLLQAQKLESIGRLAGGIAHDFNNMLFAIAGYAELLSEDLAVDRRGQLDADEALASVSAIAQATERATALTRQLLAFSRQQVVSQQVFELNAAVHSLEPMIRRLIGENVDLRLDLDPAAGRIRADRGQLDQILVNLAVNARDAMPDGGAVGISTANITFEELDANEHFEVIPGAYVMLAVSDIGVGMDRATRGHIFEPFFTTKEISKGTGLGLASIYGIVRQSGGHIWLDSEPGQGSTFKLYFPRIEAPVTPATNSTAESTPDQSGEILLVEDEPAVRDMATKLLRRAGYGVVAVADGLAAMAVASGAGWSVDVLVTDVIMPNMSGIELAERLSAGDPQMGIVLLSGYTAETLDLERLIASGAIFVSKPLTSTQLLEAVRTALA